MENNIDNCIIEKTKFLEESPGNNSSMRLMCFCSLLMSFIFGLVTMFLDLKESDMGIFLCMSYLTAAFVPKALQKPFEYKNKKEEQK